jgi:hypothetical protein
MTAPTVSAAVLVPESPERIYAFLAELDNHWHLSDRYLRLESLRADRRGGRISIRVPGGIRRTARTKVTTAIAPHRLGGIATVGARTRAHTDWSIEPSGSGARVSLQVGVSTSHGIDRLLLAVGGRWWLRRRFHRVLARLACALESSAAVR